MRLSRIHFSSRYHCVNCHETFFMNFEFQDHKNFTCEITIDSGHGDAHATDRTGFDCLNQVGSDSFSRKSDQFNEHLIISACTDTLSDVAYDADPSLSPDDINN
ncbi:hypothetical protein L1987_65834 [Smallanthus sonchifolius]|uniref:Uncharacterized protein n=1 Tax=Smallanthus sonchifolius TaxID=185202 RepID=A0ACB9BVM4_9ASTR|nr:hypothetical protein L1987_65834 [Smallanthus sonchifolius]